MDEPEYSDKQPFYDCRVGPEDETWPPEEIAIEVWSQLGKARRAIRPSSANEWRVNKCIKWIKPSRLVPECGFRVYTRGLLKKKEFAQFVVTILGRHFRLSCWVRKRGGQTILDTEDLGLKEDFFTNLNIIVEKLTEIVVQIDGWTRDGRLVESFPKEWVGPTRFELTKSLYRQYRKAKQENAH